MEGKVTMCANDLANEVEYKGGNTEEFPLRQMGAGRSRKPCDSKKDVCFTEETTELPFRHLQKPDGPSALLTRTIFGTHMS